MKSRENKRKRENERGDKCVVLGFGFKGSEAYFNEWSASVIDPI